MRQPAAGRVARASALEGLAIELAVLSLLFVIVIALLWEPSLPAVENIALQFPVALDLLLLAALYNAVRRSAVTRQMAFVWFAYAFFALALTDAPGDATADAAARAPGHRPAMVGYMIAMALMAFAARRPIRVTEAQAILGPSKTILAVLGLRLIGPASVLAPSALRPVIWLARRVPGLAPLRAGADARPVRHRPAVRLPRGPRLRPPCGRRGAGRLLHPARPC